MVPCAPCYITIGDGVMIGAGYFRLWLSGWQKPNPTSVPIPTVACDLPIPWQYQDGPYWINLQPGQSYETTTAFGIYPTLDAASFSLQYQDAWINGSVAFTFDASNPQNPVTVAPECSYYVIARSANPQIGTTFVYQKESAPLPPQLNQAIDTLMRGYAQYLQSHPGEALTTFLTNGLDCSCSAGELICAVPRRTNAADPTDCPVVGSTTAGGKSIGTPAKATSRENSVIDNHLLTYRHQATDYDAAGQGSAGCAPCGGAGSEVGTLPSLTLSRVHRYDDATWPTSFGPGASLSYDVRLQLDRGLPTGIPTITLFDPQVRFLVTLVDPESDGSYVDLEHNTIRSLALQRADGFTTGDQTQAVLAFLTTHDGHTYTFDVIDTDSGASLTRWGRPTRIADRNQQAISLAYAHPASASTAELGGERMNLWRLATITDAYARVATFTYRNSPVGGMPVVERIDLPNGQQLFYGYRATGNTDGLDGLNQVTFPGGDLATIDQQIDESLAVQARVISFNDPGAQGTHRRKTVHLTLPTYRTATSGPFQQFANKIRRVYNGAGESVSGPAT